MKMAKEAKVRAWLLAHRDYPHEDWCLIWPFACDRREGRAIANLDGERLAHRVMCKMVKGPPPTDKPQATHSCGNGDQGCVNPRHLDWGSNSDNQYQRYAHGRTGPKRSGNKSQFTPEQIETIRSQWGEFTQEKLAEMYGVTVPTIQYYLKYRETRGHAGGKIKHWTPAEDELLRQGIADGLSFSRLAAMLGRSRTATSGHVYRLGLRSGQPRATNADVQ
jgi:hypothetical protein